MKVKIKECVSEGRKGHTSILVLCRGFERNVEQRREKKIVTAGAPSVPRHSKSHTAVHRGKRGSEVGFVSTLLIVREFCVLFSLVNLSRIVLRLWTGFESGDYGVVGWHPTLGPEG